MRFLTSLNKSNRDHLAVRRFDAALFCITVSFTMGKSDKSANHIKHGRVGIYIPNYIAHGFISDIPVISMNNFPSYSRHFGHPLSTIERPRTLTRDTCPFEFETPIHASCIIDATWFVTNSKRPLHHELLDQSKCCEKANTGRN